MGIFFPEKSWVENFLLGEPTAMAKPAFLTLLSIIDPHFPTLILGLHVTSAQLAVLLSASAQLPLLPDYCPGCSPLTPTRLVRQWFR